MLTLNSVRPRASAWACCPAALPNSGPALREHSESPPAGGIGASWPAVAGVGLATHSRKSCGDVCAPAPGHSQSCRRRGFCRASAWIVRSTASFGMRGFTDVGRYSASGRTLRPPAVRRERARDLGRASSLLPADGSGRWRSSQPVRSVPFRIPQTRLH